MKAIKVRKQPNRLFRVSILPPCGKGNAKVVRDVTQERLDEVVEAEKLHRTKLLAHLREVRQKLVDDYGADPNSFDPIVE